MNASSNTLTREKRLPASAVSDIDARNNCHLRDWSLATGPFKLLGFSSLRVLERLVKTCLSVEVDIG